LKIPTRALRTSSVIAALTLSAYAFADTKPTWVLSLDSQVRWFRDAPAGVVLVGTDQEVLGVGSADGVVRWRLGPAEETSYKDVEPLDPLPFALVSLGKRKAPGLPATFLVDLRDGRTVWTADSLDVGWSIGSRLLQGQDRLLLRAALKPKGKVQTAILVDLKTGHPIWTNQQLGENFVPDPVLAAGIRGREGPLMDSDSTMILFMNSRTLRRYNLMTGAVLWESRDLPGPSAGFLERLGDETDMRSDEEKEKEKQAKEEEQMRSVVDVWCAPMIVGSGGDRFYAPYRNTVAAFSRQDGKRLWKKVPKLDGIVVQMQEIPSGLIVRTFSKSDSPHFKVELLDRGSGHPKWRVPGKGSTLLAKLGGTWSSASNFIVDGDRMLIATEGSLVAVDLAEGREHTLTELGFESGDDPAILLRVPDGFSISGAQNLGIYAADDGRRIKKFYREAPGGTGLGLALLGLSAVSYVYEFGEGLLPPSVGFNELMKDYTANQSRDEYSFFLVDLKVENDTKPGLVRVNRRTGEAEGEVVLGSKKPDYVIDSDGQVIFRPDSRTLHCYRF